MLVDCLGVRIADTIVCPNCKHNIAGDLIAEHNMALQSPYSDYLEDNTLVITCLICQSKIKCTWDDNNNTWDAEIVNFIDPNQLSLFADYEVWRLGLFEVELC